jgi:hypothetical protein
VPKFDIAAQVLQTSTKVLPASTSALLLQLSQKIVSRLIDYRKKKVQAAWVSSFCEVLLKEAVSVSYLPMKEVDLLQKQFQRTVVTEES